MATHIIYFAHGGEQRTQAPPLNLKLYEIGDDPDEIMKAGRDYGRWLIQNASGTWTRGLRQAMKDYPTMEDEEGSKNEGHQHDHSVGSGSVDT